MTEQYGCRGESAPGNQGQRSERSGIEEALERIGHKIVVLSGKGGGR